MTYTTLQPGILTNTPYALKPNGEQLNKLHTVLRTFLLADRAPAGYDATKMVKYELYWEEKKIRWYVDDQLVATMKAKATGGKFPVGPLRECIRMRHQTCLTSLTVRHCFISFAHRALGGVDQQLVWCTRLEWKSESHVSGQALETYRL